MRLLLLLPTSTYRATAFIEAARRLDVGLTVASEQPSSFETVRPDALLTLDLQNVAGAVDQALVFHARHPITAALGVDDDTAIAAAAINSGLGSRLGGPANSVDAARCARNKFLQREACGAAAVPIPRYALHAPGVDPLVHGIPFPCVVKPLRLSASRGVIRADDPPSLAAALARVERLLADHDDKRVLIEEFIEGPEVAVEGLLIDGRLEVLAVFDKPDPLGGPFFEETIYVTPSRLPRKRLEQVREVVARAVAAIGLRHGPIHAEVRVNDGGAWLIELAGRAIGGRCSAALCFGEGLSLEEIICRHALGLPLPPLARERRASGVMMIPVPGAGVLREVRGVSAARRVPLVESVEITAHPGERLVPWPEGSRYPGFIFAKGGTAQGVEAALRRAHAHLEFVLAS